jgi:hypothetical protein
MRAAFDEVVTKISANQATPAVKAKIADLFDKATVRFSASQSLVGSGQHRPSG